LLDQWATEIEKHTSCDLAVMRYSAGKRVDSNRAGNIIDGHDIVLTTWDEVRKSYPKYEPPQNCQDPVERFEWWKKRHDEGRGQLHRVEFLRIVLDEAQAIKNHRSQTSIACRGLIGRHKWALSGTPILNGVFELYPYFKFIGVPHTGVFEDFESNYCDVSVGVDRLLIRLSQFMLRRTHSDKMFGAPILKLPRADQSIYWCDFNPVERLVYDIVWKRFWQKAGMEFPALEFETGSQGPGRGKKNRKLKSNSSGKPRKGRSYNCTFVLLLRLRQLCSHILMLQFVMRDLLELEDIVEIAKVVSTEAANRDSSSGRTIVAIRRQLDDLSKQETSKANDSSISISSDEDDSEDDMNTTADTTEGEHGDGTIPDFASQMTVERQRSGRDFGKKFDFNPFLKSLETSPEHKQKKKEALCSWCGKPPTTPWSMSCSHLICADCLEQANEEAAEGLSTFMACNICSRIPTFVQEVEDEDDESQQAVSRGTRSKKKKPKKSSSEDGEEFPKEWLNSIDDDLLPSAKTIAIKAQIMNWIKENKDVKIIVFTQFLPM
jgi:SNF2 family DNA or RNA helicase